jgi:N-acetylmuramoyl-L-alanine amidase
MKRTVLIISIFAVLSSLAFAAPDVFVAYPPNNYEVPFDHVLLEGSVTAGADLKINGSSVDVGTDGLFIEWYPLQPGKNTLSMLTTLAGETGKLEYTVISSPRVPLGETPTKIVTDSITPFANAAYFALNNDIIQISFQGSPAGTASFKIGDKGPFKLLERSSEFFLGFKTPAEQQALKGQYEGSYVLQAGDNFENAPVTISLTGKDGVTVNAVSEGKITVKFGQPRVGVFTGEPSAGGISSGTNNARNGVGNAYVLYPRKGAKFSVIGEEFNTYRCKLNSGQIVYVRKERMTLMPEGAAQPKNVFTDIVTRRVKGATQVRFLTADIVPHWIDEAKQSLELKLYYTLGDVDYMNFAGKDPNVADLRWYTDQDNIFTAKIDLKQNQLWGYKAFFDGNTFVLEIRDAPKIDTRNPLQGQNITIDPGHGGEDTGGAGPLRQPEKQIVLTIGMQLAEALKAKGATVTLTRSTDVEVDLFERSFIADRAGSSIFASIHANALPDGVDPKNSRGWGSYFFNPMARPLAQAVQNAALALVPDMGDDGVHYQNLAVARPTQIPQVLIEVGFLTDKGNLRLMSSVEGKRSIVNAIVRGFENFYRNARTR